VLVSECVRVSVGDSVSVFCVFCVVCEYEHEMLVSLSARASERLDPGKVRS